ncbi:hypothetical protein [Haloarchaeobius sp. HRN-SO-5]|uniref:hypothetical protein n=1 Tax=Haloarchaeobius sp. HRN-SO-5 TaxID=3446118 RepID=UPI003EBB3A1D
MSTNEPIDADGTDDEQHEREPRPRAELAAQVDVLQEENHRLREEYRRATQATYRRTATALFATGLLALAGGAVLPAVREPLVIVGAIGVFAGVLTWYLTPERVLTATVTEGLYDAHADTISALVEELGLRDDRLYVGHDGSARLFVPLHATYSVPDSLDDLFVVTDDESERGVALAPTGAPLYDEFERASPVAESESEDVGALLADGLVEQLELVDSVDASVDGSEGRASFDLTGVAIDGLTRPDHPAVSFLGVGLAAAHDGPVRLLAVERTETGWTATFTWEYADDGR